MASAPNKGGCVSPHQEGDEAQAQAARSMAEEVQQLRKRIAEAEKELAEILKERDKAREERINVEKERDKAREERIKADEEWAKECAEAEKRTEKRLAEERDKEREWRTKADEEWAKECAEAEKRRGIDQRLRGLQSASTKSIPQLQELSNSRATSTHGGVVPMKNLTRNADDMVWEGIPVHPNEDELYAEVQKRAARVKQPPAKAAKYTVVHGYFKSIFKIIQNVARARGIRVHDYFYEHEYDHENATASTMSPHCTFVHQSVQLHLPMTSLWYMEVSRPGISHDPDYPEFITSEGAAVRDALAQCIARLHARTLSLNFETTHGIGLACTSTKAALVRINWLIDGADSFPVFLSTPVALIAKGTDTTSTIAQPDGLRAMLRLMLVDTREPFGLCEFSREIPGGHSHLALLGSGGFANVHLIRKNVDGSQPVAFKRMRVSPFALAYIFDSHGGSAVELQAECTMLEKLRAAHVPHTPTLVEQFDAGFTLTPVGVSLPKYMQAHPEHFANVDNRVALAAVVFRTLADSLEAAHKNAQILHMDVSPNNVLVVPSESDAPTADDFYLADWGLAKPLEQQTSDYIFGARSFLADNLLVLCEGSRSTQRKEWTPTAAIDDDSILFTVLAIIGDPAARAPWSVGISSLFLINHRSTYISALQYELKELHMDSLTVLLDSYLSRASEILAKPENAKDLNGLMFLFSDVEPVHPSEELRSALRSFAARSRIMSSAASQPATATAREPAHGRPAAPLAPPSRAPSARADPSDLAAPAASAAVRAAQVTLPAPAAVAAPSLAPHAPVAPSAPAPPGTSLAPPAVLAPPAPAAPASPAAPAVGAEPRAARAPVTAAATRRSSRISAKNV